MRAKRSGLLKSGILAPLTILLFLLAVSVWNGRALSAHAQRWQDQTVEVETMVRREDWSGAAAALSDSYRDWQGERTHLQIVCRHDGVDNAEDLYRRCLILLQGRAPGEVLAELESLRDQLGGLAERERFSVGNIL